MLFFCCRIFCSVFRLFLILFWLYHFTVAGNTTSGAFLLFCLNISFEKHLFGTAGRWILSCSDTRSFPQCSRTSRRCGSQRNHNRWCLKAQMHNKLYYYVIATILLHDCRAVMFVRYKQSYYSTTLVMPTVESRVTCIGTKCWQNELDS